MGRNIQTTNMVRRFCVHSLFWVVVKLRWKQQSPSCTCIPLGNGARILLLPGGLTAIGESPEAAIIRETAALIRCELLATGGASRLHQQIPLPRPGHLSRPSTSNLQSPPPPRLNSVFISLPYEPSSTSTIHELSIHPHSSPSSRANCNQNLQLSSNSSI